MSTYSDQFTPIQSLPIQYAPTPEGAREANAKSAELQVALDDKTARAVAVYETEAYRDVLHVSRRQLWLALWASREEVEGGLRYLRDILVATGTLVVLSPAIALVALLIKLESPGPVLFRQQRVGKYGQLFTLYKFRSMVDGADEMKEELIDLNEADPVHFKIRKDPRMTRFGWFIRKTSIDELPQLINVLKGEMSTVGPRPALPSEVAEFDYEHLRRLDVAPGLTGLQQVSGRSDLNYEQWMDFDNQYVEERSLSKDAEILIRTIPAVISGKGAY